MSDSPLSVPPPDPEVVVDSSPTPLPPDASSQRIGQDHPRLDASPLLPGTILLDRLTVVALLSSEDGANVYRVALAQLCPNCGVENEGGAQACGFCGQELPAARTFGLVESLIPPNGQSIPTSFISDGKNYVLIRDADVIPQVTQPAVHLSYAYATDVGLVHGTRGDPNEDCVLAQHLSLQHASAVSTFALFSVADGVGGAAAGEVASLMATRIVAHQVMTRLLAPGADLENGQVVRDALCAAIHSANTAVLEYAQDHHIPLGTTLTAMVVVDARAYIANVGDSRTYLWRDHTLTQITQDHSYIARLLEKGEITPDAARVHPQRNLILRSLGDLTGYEVDVFPPGDAGLELIVGDQVLLCSDGLWELVTDDEIANVLGQGWTAAQTSAALVSHANAAGGVDNISVIVVQAH